MLDDEVGRSAGQPGDLGAQLVPGAARPGGDVGLGLGLQFGDFGIEPRATVGEQRLGLSVGVGEEALALGFDVAERLSDPRRVRFGVLPSSRRVVEFALDLVGAGGHRLLDQRAGLPDQQRDDDHRGDAAVDDLGLLGPQWVVGRVALVVDAVLLGGKVIRPGDQQRGQAAHLVTPALITALTAAPTASSSG